MSNVWTTTSRKRIPAPQKIGNNVNRRDRMISFRVSQEEFQNLHQFCHATGNRSVSELARSAVKSLVNGTDGVATWESRIKAVEKEIQRLQALVKPGASRSATAGHSMEES